MVKNNFKLCSILVGIIMIPVFEAFMLMFVKLVPIVSLGYGCHRVPSLDTTEE